MGCIDSTQKERGFRNEPIWCLYIVRFWMFLWKEEEEVSSRSRFFDFLNYYVFKKILLRFFDHLCKFRHISGHSQRPPLENRHPQDGRSKVLLFVGVEKVPGYRCQPRRTLRGDPDRRRTTVEHRPCQIGMREFKKGLRLSTNSISFYTSTYHFVEF